MGIDNGYTSENGRVIINAAGKNFGAFDCPFLEEKTSICKHVKFRHRFLDPGPMYMTKSDDAVPGLDECLRRIGIQNPIIAHTAIEDAIDVIKVIRFKLLETKA